MKKGLPFSEVELSEWHLSQEEGDGFSEDDNNSLNPQDSSTTIEVLKTEDLKTEEWAGQSGKILNVSTGVLFNLKSNFP